jgi:hypothetical protein
MVVRLLALRTGQFYPQEIRGVRFAGFSLQNEHHPKSAAPNLQHKQTEN